MIIHISNHKKRSVKDLFYCTTDFFRSDISYINVGSNPYIALINSMRLSVTEFPYGLPVSVRIQIIQSGPY